jgi:hypothetical protein
MIWLKRSANRRSASADRLERFFQPGTQPDPTCIAHQYSLHLLVIAVVSLIFAMVSVVPVILTISVAVPGEDEKTLS